MEAPSSATPTFCPAIIGCWGLILSIFLTLRREKVNKKSRRVRIHKKMLFFKKALKVSLPSDANAYAVYTEGLIF